MLSFPTDLQMPNSYLQPSWPLICEFNIYKAVLMPWMQNLLRGISCQHISVICTQGLFFRNSKQPILINMINTLKIIAWHTTPSYYVFFFSSEKMITDTWSYMKEYWENLVALLTSYFISISSETFLLLVSRTFFRLHWYWFSGEKKYGLNLEWNCMMKFSIRTDWQSHFY